MDAWRHSYSRSLVEIRRLDWRSRTSLRHLDAQNATNKSRRLKNGLKACRWCAPVTTRLVKIPRNDQPSLEVRDLTTRRVVEHQVKVTLATYHRFQKVSLLEKITKKTQTIIKVWSANPQTTGARSGYWTELRRLIRKMNMKVWRSIVSKRCEILFSLSFCSFCFNTNNNLLKNASQR